MRRHRFHGELGHGICEDCGTRCKWVAEAWFYMPRTGGGWSRRRPECRPVQPKASEVRA